MVLNTGISVILKSHTVIPDQMNSEPLCQEFGRHSCACQVRHWEQAVEESRKVVALCLAGDQGGEMRDSSSGHSYD